MNYLQKEQLKEAVGITLVMLVLMVVGIAIDNLLVDIIKLWS